MTCEVEAEKHEEAAVILDEEKGCPTEWDRQCRTILIGCLEACHLRLLHLRHHKATRETACNGLL